MKNSSIGHRGKIRLSIMGKNREILQPVVKKKCENRRTVWEKYLQGKAAKFAKRKKENTVKFTNQSRVKKFEISFQCRKKLRFFANQSQQKAKKLATLYTETTAKFAYQSLEKNRTKFEIVSGSSEKIAKFDDQSRKNPRFSTIGCG